MDGLPEQQLRAYVEYLRELGIYDLYRRDDPQVMLPATLAAKLAQLPGVAAAPPASSKAPVPARPASAPPAIPTAPRRAAADVAPPSAQPSAQTAAHHAAQPSAQTHSPGSEPVELPPELAAPMPKPLSFDALAPLPVQILAAGERAAALDAVRAEIGDCTRCPLAYAGRHNIVFGDGDPSARLMFVGEGPGADEDAQGLPFVGKAGQLLNNMIQAMGLKREEVYIANIVKCRPPGNRTPEFAEATTCSQFLVKQIDIVRPQVIVALGATAATYLLGVRQSLGSLRGQWHAARGAKVAVTYHPAFLLRDPRQKGEAWKDLQRVMVELGLAIPKKSS
jgi:uracil-DNA glycosylase family 4